MTVSSEGGAPRGGGVVRALRQMLGLDGLHRQVAALPWRVTPRGVEVMLITSRDSGRWVLPKGWPEGDEAFFDAAAREAAEEAGLSGDISEVAAGRYVYRKAKRSGRALHCEVLVYPMKVEHVANRWPERKRRRRAWFPASEAAARVEEQELAALIAAFPGRNASA